MEWIQFALMIITFVGLFIWNRTESRSDMRHIDAIIKAIQQDGATFRAAMAQEMKDFHGRLERQDAEFRGRAEKLDAEFKMHLMYAHGEKK